MNNSLISLIFVLSVFLATFFIFGNEKHKVLFFPVKTNTILDEDPEMKATNRSIISSLKSSETVTVFNSEVVIQKIENESCQTNFCYKENTTALQADYFVTSFIQPVPQKEGDYLVMKLFSVNSMSKPLFQLTVKVDSIENLKQITIKTFNNLVLQGFKPVEKKMEKENKKPVVKEEKPVEVKKPEPVKPVENVKSSEPSLVPIVPVYENKPFEIGKMNFNGKSKIKLIKKLLSSYKLKKIDGKSEKAVAAPSKIMISPVLHKAYFDAVEADNGDSKNYEDAIKKWLVIIETPENPNPYLPQAKERHGYLTEKVLHTSFIKFNENVELEKKIRMNPTEVIKMWQKFLKENPMFENRKIVEEHIRKYLELSKSQKKYVDDLKKFSIQFEEDRKNLKNYLDRKDIDKTEKKKKAELFTMTYLPVFGNTIFESFNIEKNNEIWGFTKDTVFSNILWNKCKNKEEEYCSAIAYLLVKDNKNAALVYLKNACDQNVIPSCKEHYKIENDKKSKQIACLGGDGEACFLLSKDKPLSKEEINSLIDQSCVLEYEPGCKAGGKK